MIRGPGPARAALLAGLLALAVWLGLLADPAAPFGRLSWLAYDAVVQWHRPVPRPDPRVVIVDIDDAALAREGRWPWPRARLAALLAAIQAAGPAQVGLDILLPEPAPGDTALAAALAADNVVAAVALGDLRPPPDGERAGLARRALPPAASLQPAAVGHITPLHDRDGHIRRLYPRLCQASAASAPRCHDTLALVMLERWMGLPARWAGEGAGAPLCVAGFCQWPDRRGRVLIPYQQRADYDYLSAAQVLRGAHRERLAGRLVLVGTSAAGLGDLVATPRGALTPGVELHALLLSAWLDSRRWQPLPGGGLAQGAGLLLLGGLTLLALQRPPRRWPRWGLGLVGSALLLAPAGAALAGYWLDPLGGLLGVGALALYGLGEQRWILWRRHRRLYRTFGAYVPRSVLRQLVAVGGEARFAPQRRRLVVLFSDIRDFTALSERTAPERLVALTNHLFSELTAVVHAHGGTLDKYIGDSLMAFWGAPLAHPEDDRRALACAQAMQQRLVAINRWATRQGLAPVAMHTGLEAGEVTVGNLGSRQRHAYTALGPAVNLAARLEEHAGQVNEPILVGPALAQALAGQPGAPALVPLGHVPLKGVGEPVALWRPAPQPNPREPSPIRAGR